eukprot:6460921-Prymnesium_polylepis.1
MGAHSERGVSCGCGRGCGVLGPSIVQRQRVYVARRYEPRCEGCVPGTRGRRGGQGASWVH